MFAKLNALLSAGGSGGIKIVRFLQIVAMSNDDGVDNDISNGRFKNKSKMFVINTNPRCYISDLTTDTISVTSITASSHLDYAYMFIFEIE